MPAILTTGKHRIGLLGYYWNPRCAATADLPGAAISDPDRIRAAVSSLRSQVDFLVVSFHWGDTYAREPSAKAEMKARLAIDAGADLVVGHHPHVIQPLKFHQGKPIFFSIGKALMGSGNSRAEGMALALRIMGNHAQIDIFSLYVKNRDPRINYQTKVMAGGGGTRILQLLKSRAIKDHGGIGRLTQ